MNLRSMWILRFRPSTRVGCGIRVRLRKFFPDTADSRRWEKSEEILVDVYLYISKKSSKKNRSKKSRCYERCDEDQIDLEPQSKSVTIKDDLDQLVMQSC